MNEDQLDNLSLIIDTAIKETIRLELQFLLDNGIIKDEKTFYILSRIEELNREIRDLEQKQN